MGSSPLERRNIVVHSSFSRLADWSVIVNLTGANRPAREFPNEDYRVLANYPQRRFTKLIYCFLGDTHIVITARNTV